VRAAAPPRRLPRPEQAGRRARADQAMKISSDFMMRDYYKCLLFIHFKEK
jgi:hypothetical protein